MLSERLLVVSVLAAAAATLMAPSRGKQQETTLLKALKEMNQTFIEVKNKWEESQLLLEEKIKEMVQMEKRLGEVEAEGKRNYQVIAALKEERRQERNQWMEERVKLIRVKEALSQKCLYADHKKADTQIYTKTTENKVLKMEECIGDVQLDAQLKTLLEEKIKEMVQMENRLGEVETEGKRNYQIIAALKEERRKERNQWTEERVKLIREKEALSQKCLYAEHKKGDAQICTKTTENNKVLKMEEYIEDVQLDAQLKTLTKQLSSSDVYKLTLDPNTAHSNLSLSENNRKVTRVAENQLYPHHPNRFNSWEQVLCREALTVRCYWEVEWNGKVSVAVTYKGINRRGMGDDCAFGYNDKSWSLECNNVLHLNRCSVRHNRKKTELGTFISNRVGVYLDCPAGTLSFYRVFSDTRTHLYTFRCTFTEPLYPGFMFSSDSSVSLC